MKLKLSHWLSLSQPQRQALVDWSDAPDALDQMRRHLRTVTRDMADGIVGDLMPVVDAPWQQGTALPDEIRSAAEARNVDLTPQHWAALSELERFALCKLVRPGHDHHNLAAALNEVLA